MRHLAAKSPYFSMIPWTNLGTYMDSERTIIRSIGTYMRYPTAPVGVIEPSLVLVRIFIPHARAQGPELRRRC